MFVSISVLKTIFVVNLCLGTNLELDLTLLHRLALQIVERGKAPHFYWRLKTLFKESLFSILNSYHVCKHILYQGLSLELFFSKVFRFVSFYFFLLNANFDPWYFARLFADSFDIFKSHHMPPQRHFNAFSCSYVSNTLHVQTNGKHTLFFISCLLFTF